jgi:hypothetical protein
MSAVMDEPGDNEYVTVTRNARNQQVRVGTYENPHGDKPHVIFYAPEYHRWDVNSSFTVVGIIVDNLDPLVNQLWDEHCAADPYRDLGESYTQDESGAFVAAE